jgi:hypothetical protein
VHQQNKEVHQEAGNNTNMKNISPRLKNEITRKLKEYGRADDRHHAQEPNYENFPTAWMQGRGSSANEPKIYDKDRDYDETNFRKKNSGQDDIEEASNKSPEGSNVRGNELDKNGFVDNATSSTAWLMSREGRKFQKQTYDKDGTYDGENFVAKNSGQPDLEEALQMKISDIRDIIPDGDYDNKELRIDLVKALNHIYKKYNSNIRVKL